MKRRFANSVSGIYKQVRLENNFFKGYVCNIKVQGVSKPLIVNNGIEEVCLMDNNYEWFEIYPDNGYYALTIMFDDHKNLIEWYFDIAKQIGLENGVPYEDDLYLDMVVTPSGQKLVLDENELIEAFNKGEIGQEDVNLSYSTLKDVEEKYVNNFQNLIDFSNVVSNLFKSECKVKNN